MVARGTVTGEVSVAEGDSAGDSAEDSEGDWDGDGVALTLADETGDGDADGLGGDAPQPASPRRAARATTAQRPVMLLTPTMN